jgi:hypothetical protein
MLEMALALCPNAPLADNLSTTFGLDPIDAAATREATEEHVALAAKILPLSDYPPGPSSRSSGRWARRSRWQRLLRPSQSGIAW